MTAKARLRAALMLVVLALGPVACTSDAFDAALTPTTRDDRSATHRTQPGATDDDWDQVMFDAADDVERYWSETFSELYDGRYRPIEGGFHPYSSQSNPPPCGRLSPTYEDIADNAFYCPQADLVAWDSELLAPRIYRQFGPFALAIIMAHEIGHAVQVRAEVGGASIMLEQQADCFAGSWTAWVADGRAEHFDVELSDLDAAVAGYLQLADLPGQLSSDPGAHGSAFDRVGAFQDGFDQGASRCAEYADGAFQTFQLPFNDVTDYEQGGNLPYDDVDDVALADLEDYWSTVFPATFGRDWETPEIRPFDPSDPPACGGETRDDEDYELVAFYCAADDYIGWDEEGLMPRLYEEIGDWAVATIVGGKYARAAQDQAELLDSTLDSNLQADCFDGTWAASIVRQDRSSSQVLLSPGDLDEAVTAFLAFGDHPEPGSDDDPVNGTAFQRVGAYRDGFINGMEKCLTYQ